MNISDVVPPIDLFIFSFKFSDLIEQSQERRPPHILLALIQQYHLLDHLFYIKNSKKESKCKINNNAK